MKLRLSSKTTPAMFRYLMGKIRYDGSLRF
jgi:hypothetical protein